MNQGIESIINGDRRALAKAITLIESIKAQDRASAQQLLQQLLPKTGNSIRIGITGVPGVGKSTFIEAFGSHLIALGKKVAVLAVDPSSPVAGGSILGDKVRMELLSRQPQAFIRPSPSSGALGGVANKTRESLLLCEAAGFDVILVETVGVGQSEYQVAGMVDFFMVLMLPNAGDEIQGIKKGIMELADAVIINKADGDSIKQAQQTCNHYQNAINLLSHNSFWTPQVLSCSALEKQNISNIWEMIVSYEKEAQNIAAFTSNRAKQNIQWMRNLIHECLALKLNAKESTRKRQQELEKAVTDGTITPYAAAQEIINSI